MDSKDQIKSNLNVVDVVGEYINLQSAGSNFRAPCPFHQEKSPSFMVSQEKQIWHCFGCGEGGDIFSFVMKIEGLSFVEALRLLAPKAGVELKRQDPKVTSERNRALDILDISSSYYHQVLCRDASPCVSKAREYLAKRALSQDTIDEWRIGYSPDSWDDLINILKNKGFSDNDILASGMSIKKDRGYGYYNRFRGRIMFPIRDISSNVVAFTARVSPEKESTEKMGKYINSPQTTIYDKSNIIFGLEKAKMSIKKQDLAVVVEGQMDVITAHQNGFTNTIASSGTALTRDQVNILKRYSNNLSLAFDADAAGGMAAERGIAQAMEVEMNIKVVEVPLGKDPDDCIRNNPADWQEAIAKAKLAMEYFFDKSLSDLGDIGDINNKRKAAQKILPRISKLGNKIEQDFWIKKLSQIIDVEENILRETLIQFMQKNVNKKNINNREQSRQFQKRVLPQRDLEYNSNLPREEKLSKMLIALMLKFNFLIEIMVNKLSPDKIIGQSARDLYYALLIYYTSSEDRGLNNEFDYSSFKLFLEKNKTGQDTLNILDQLIISGDCDFSEYDADKAKIESLDFIRCLEESHSINKSKNIERLIRQAEQNNDQDEINKLMKEFNNLRNGNSPGSL